MSILDITITIISYFNPLHLLPVIVYKVLGYDLVKRGKIEFNCKQAQYYPTPKEQTFVIVHLEINNISTALDTITKIRLEIKNNQYIAGFPSSLLSPFGEFIGLPFKVASRGEGYYKRAVYFTTQKFSLKDDFTVDGNELKSIPAKLIIKRATSKKEHIIDIAINLAPAEYWPTNTTVERIL